MNFKNSPIDSVAFEIGKDSRIYIKGRINNSEELRFLFDTGATDMVFNPNSPRKFRMEFDKSISNNGPGSSSVRLSSKNKFQIGNQTIDDISFIEIPSADFWDGVSGLSFIRKNITRIDYGRRKIYFYK